MFGNFKIHLRAAGNHVLGWFIGHQVRAAVLALIAKYDNDLAQQLHAPHKTRQYAIGHPTLNHDNFWPRKDQVHIREGQKLVVRVRTLTEHLTTSFVKAWINRDQDDQFTLYNRKFLVESIEMQTLSQNDFESYLQLPITHCQVGFLTPTQFSRHDQNSPWYYPDPATCLISAALIWNDLYQEQQLDIDNFKNYLTGHCKLKKIYRAWTENIRMGKAYKTGLVGKVLWDFDTEASTVFNHWCQALLQFATFSNLGKSRTGGMGVIGFKDLTQKSHDT